MYTRQFTPERITSLKDNEIFVFGSNLDGLHGGGAARIAYEKFGAIWGKGVGMQGQSYAIPTMHGGVDAIKPYVDDFVDYAKTHTDYLFYVTRIGCGIAGFTDAEIAPLFNGCLYVSNVILPKSFVDLIDTVHTPSAVKDMLYGQTRTLIDILKAMNKEMPVKSAEDARERLSKFVEENQRQGDETGFMAQRTIWCLLSKYEQEDNGIDLGRLEKEMIAFHEDRFSNSDFFKEVDMVYYKYCVSKIIRYISFLDQFRRYKSFSEIREDLFTIDNHHCSENRPDYFFSFAWRAFHELCYSFNYRSGELFKDGRLDENQLERVFFTEHKEMLDELGLEELIRQEYEMVGCHAEIQAPKRILGPVYIRRESGKYMPACNGTDRIQGAMTAFELRKAEVLIRNDENYSIGENRYGRCTYVPVSDNTLPVFLSGYGIMEFESQDEKNAFIEMAKHGHRR